MVIRGGSKDYYDGLQSLDRDKEVVYHRDCRSFKIHDQELPREFLEFFSEHRYLPPLYYKAGAGRESTPSCLGALIFCGVPYPLIYRDHNRYNSWNRGCLLEALESQLEFEWMKNSKDCWVPELDKDGKPEQWTRRDSISARIAETRYQYFLANNTGLTKMEVEALLLQFDEVLGDLDMSALCLKYEAPILSLPMGGFGPYRELTINPTLRHLEFQKKMGAHQCYQELMMFIGGKMAALCPDPAPQTVGSDKVICAQKGFDPVTSFRQAPGRKEETRRRNRLRKRGLV